MSMSIHFHGDGAAPTVLDENQFLSAPRIASGDLAIFTSSHRGYARRSGEAVLVMFAIDAHTERVWQVKTRDARLLLALESELTRKDPTEITT